MAAADPLQALRVPGRVVKGVTSFSGSFPYGGTELGQLLDVAWALTQIVQRTRAEELGAQVVGLGFYGEAFAVSFGLRSLDDDAIAAVFLNTRAGTVSQHRVIYGPGTNRPGTLIETVLATNLLFVPDDVDNHPCVWLPRAVPKPDRLERVPLHLDGEHVIGSTWLALPGSNGKAYEIGRLVDLTAP